MNKKLIVGVIVALAIVGGYFYPGAKNAVYNTTTMQADSAAATSSSVYNTTTMQAGSAVGTTFNTAKVATVTMSPATAAATSSSVYNGDDSNRYIESLNAYCISVGTSQTFLTGGGLASLTITAATSTIASTGAQGNTNTFTGTIATTTANSLLSSVISSTGTAVQYIWAPGTYLNFTFNATNTAACVVGVNYLAS